MHWFDVFSTLWAMLHIFIMIALLLELRFHGKRLCLLLCCLALPLLFLNVALLLWGGLSTLRGALHLSYALPGLLLFFFLSRSRNGRFFFTVFVCGSIAYAMMILTALADAYLLGGNGIFLLCSRLVLFPTIELIILLKIRPAYLAMQRMIPGGWTVLAIMAAIYYLLFRLVAAYPKSIVERPEDIPVALICCALMPLTYITCFRLLREQQKSFIVKEAERESLQQARILQSELDTEKAFVLNAKRYRHDLRHHTALLLEYLRLGDIDGARAYLTEYDRSISESALEDFCENKTVNAIIRMTARHCRLHEIEFFCQTEIPAALPLSDIETSALFGNLLENAREACDAADLASKKLHITAEVRNDLLCVEIKNSVSGMVTFSEDVPVSTKTDGGVGVLSMKAILGEHGGMLSYQQADDLFLSRIILPLAPQI